MPTDMCYGFWERKVASSWRRLGDGPVKKSRRFMRLKLRRAQHQHDRTAHTYIYTLWQRFLSSALFDEYESDKDDQSDVYLPAL